MNTGVSEKNTKTQALIGYNQVPIIFISATSDQVCKKMWNEKTLRSFTKNPLQVLPNSAIIDNTIFHEKVL